MRLRRAGDEWRRPAQIAALGAQGQNFVRLTRPQKITLGEMRASGVRDLLIYCAHYKCSRWIRLNADQYGGRRPAVRSRRKVCLLDVRPPRCGHQAGFSLGQAGRAYEGLLIGAFTCSAYFWFSVPDKLPALIALI